MWYVIQTMTGAEETLMLLIQEQIPRDCYQDCFYIKREYARKEKDRYQVYLTPLFPAYFFVSTDRPKELYYELKKVPKLTKLLKSEEETFLGVTEEEQEFLESIQDEDHVVRRSLVQVDEEGQIIHAEGAVGRYMDCVVKQRLRKRSVWIERWFMGRKRLIMLGVKVDGDVEE